MRIFNRTMDPRVVMAKVRPGVILTSLYDINGWEKLANRVVGIARHRIRGMVNDGTISLPPLQSSPCAWI